MLETTSHILGIIASLIAIAGVVYALKEYRMQKALWQLKTKRLVDHLKASPKSFGPNDKGQRTVLHLIRYVGLTSDEILKISFENPHISRSVSKDDTGKSEHLLFEFTAART